jgi:oxalate decarboxylase/phosphoglucose isomerase-like protein (cupin superfamily)
MKRFKTGSQRGSFDVVTSTCLAQAAKMTLRAGAASDSHPSNEHPHSEQWLFVISGTGEAIVHDRSGKVRRTKLQPNSLLVIERGERHQIKNTGRRQLATLNIYVPPAYTGDGELRDDA